MAVGDGGVGGAVSFSDQPAPSPLRWRVFVFLGHQTTRLVHGNRRSNEGELMTRRHYLTAEVEWRLGQTYLGLLGLLALPLGGLYIETFARDVGRYSHGRHYLGHWNDLPSDLRIVIPLMFIAHIIGMVSAVRYFVVSNDFRPIGQNKK